MRSILITRISRSTRKSRAIANCRKLILETKKSASAKTINTKSNKFQRQSLPITKFIIGRSHIIRKTISSKYQPTIVLWTSCSLCAVAVSSPYLTTWSVSTPISTLSTAMTRLQKPRNNPPLINCSFSHGLQFCLMYSYVHRIPISLPLVLALARLHLNECPLLSVFSGRATVLAPCRSARLCLLPPFASTVLSACVTVCATT
mmetsp:Transcript_57273/g.134305  ORF Transcript_57273/g.134305 Transcript_57273/m.134305 type:complete len:203 (+) Transcript_57273:1503-2111(+)